MPVETDPVGYPKRSWLADIVQQRAPSQSRRASCTKIFHQQHRVHKDVALGMKLWWLFDAFHLRDLRQYFFQQPTFVEQLESSSRAPFSKHLGQFFAHTLA